jgi:hypothetical protein
MGLNQAKNSTISEEVEDGNISEFRRNSVRLKKIEKNN